MEEKTKALVLLSGGQDSTTCLYWALQRFDEVKAIGFNYNQTHAKELEQAAKIADLAGVSFKVLQLQNLLSGSSLTDAHQQDPQERHNAQHAKNNALPASFLPARNMLFLTLAASLAYQENIQDIVTGVCQTDYSGYPDCRRTFIDSMEVSQSLALETDMRIHTPLMYLTKAETWRMANKLDCLDVVRNYSLTDYNGDMSKKNDWGYGRLDNPASVLRAKGYQEALDKGWI